MGIERLSGHRGHIGPQHGLQQGKGLKLGLLKHAMKPGDEGLSLGKVANKALYKELLARLNEAVGYAGQEHIETLDPKDYTPEAVADRILGVVEGAMKLARLNGGDEAALEKLAQARRGIEKGFKEARDMLESMGVFEGLVAENANKTWDLLQQGLDRLQAGESLTAAVTDEVLAVGASQQESMELSLTTRDGDKVTLHLARSESAQHVRQDNGSGSTEVYAWRRSESLYLSVEGQLDEEERAAINQLVDESLAVSDSFFNGDAHAAFNHLLAEGHDSSEIASYALRINQQESRSAVHAYRTVGGLESEKAQQTYPRTLIRPIHEYLQQLDGSLQRMRQNTLFAEPQQALADGVEKLSYMDDKKRGLANALEHRAGKSLSAFNRNLMDLMQSQQERFTAQGHHDDA